MTRLSLTLVRLTPAAAAAALLAACASAPAPKPAAVAAPAHAPVRAAPPPVAVVRLTPGERARRATELLGKGETEAARAELQALLADAPANNTGRILLEQLDKDPRLLLGERNFPYRIKAGETLSALAERYLGDARLFYALARYNDIPAPDTAEPGRTILIPGSAKRASAAPAAPGPTPSAAKPSPAPANPARAGALRRAALENLNRGAVDRAVALLQEAGPLDPANPLIRTDLARALRIQAELKRR